ncbi:alpha/beta hydrolase [Aliiroseovarius sp. M344]|uniref:alpha/beta fold hydrolase n=1 Tax=Aliiroseovarius sp. M344 TaxID=2867010 RepID=UPI0021AE1A94|nr:alpha/beta hydrolase [Aliiroseovarius sp. M344]UWQ15126.1 alpha/beta hydrolase [Aliiroseovarius sp. M344]
MKLFIHGVPDTGYMWSPVIKALGLAEGDYLNPTMPGFNGATPAGFAATKEAYLDWVIKTLESAANTHGPIDLVGHDWGAPLAAVAAHSRPAAIRTWTVVNAVPEPTYEWHSLAKTWQTPILGEVFMLLGNSKKFHQQLISAGMPKPIADHEAPRIDGHMKRAILKLYRSAKNPGAWMGAFDFSNIADRGLVMWGENDPFVPLGYANRFCSRWDIPLVIQKDVGHWGICETPEAFARHLAAHWAR